MAKEGCDAIVTAVTSGGAAGPCYFRRDVQSQNCIDTAAYDTYTAAGSAGSPAAARPPRVGNAPVQAPRQPTAPPVASRPSAAPSPGALPPAPTSAPNAWWCGNTGNWAQTAEWVHYPLSLLKQGDVDFPVFTSPNACGKQVYELAKKELGDFALFGKKLHFSHLFAWSQQLLRSNPFLRLSGKQLPYTNVRANQPGTCIVLSHRQLAYCLVNVLYGNTVKGFEW